MSERSCGAFIEGAKDWLCAYCKRPAGHDGPCSEVPWRRELPTAPDGLTYKQSPTGEWYAAEPGGVYLAVKARIAFVRPQVRRVPA